MSLEISSRAPSRIHAALRRSSLFSGLSERELAALEAQLSPVTLVGGEDLFRQGDPGDSLYIVVSGRLRVLHASADGVERVIAQLGHGEIVGEMGLVCNEPRSATVRASRDSQLARLSAAGLECLAAEYAQPIYSAIVRQLAARLRTENAGAQMRKPAPVCIAIAGLTDETPVAAFTQSLTSELAGTGTVLRLNGERLDSMFGETGAAQARPGSSTHASLAGWLSAQETRHRKVLYEAGSADSEWTARCIRQSDIVLLIAGASDAKTKARDRAAALGVAGCAEKPVLLVLLHETGKTAPKGTLEWTRSIQATRHFHVRMNSTRDFARLARYLNDRSVGLALGGGFARGIAHVGVIRAMRELEIPIDFVGGTSMGAIVAAECALEWGWREMLEVTCRRAAESLKGDHTLPVVSFLSGRKFSRVIASIAGAIDIEDAWLPFFCVSASLTRGEMKIHASGNAARSLIASARAPGLFPPVTWDGELLVDGGLVNMVPSDVMRGFVGQGTVAAVDVSPPLERGAVDFGLSFSGWEALRRRLGVFSKRSRMPGMIEILMRTLELGRGAAARAKHPADASLTLPVSGFGYRDFDRGAEMAEVGYRFAMEYFGKWIEECGRPWLKSE